jgi:hypothetical protein
MAVPADNLPIPIPGNSLLKLVAPFGHTTSSAGNAVIQLNTSQMDPDESLAYTMETLIHELFHAMIAADMYSTYGNYSLSSIPSTTTDPILQFLYNDYHSATNPATSLNAAGHDWMAANISAVASVLQQFLQTNYPSVAADEAALSPASNPLAPYETFIYDTDSDIGIGSKYASQILTTIGNPSTTLLNEYVADIGATVTQTCPN